MSEVKRVAYSRWQVDPESGGGGVIAFRLDERENRVSSELRETPDPEPPERKRPLRLPIDLALGVAALAGWWIARRARRERGDAEPPQPGATPGELRRWVAIAAVAALGAALVYLIGTAFTSG